MTPASGAVPAHLPLRIDRAEVHEPTLLVGGAGWFLSATCSWRWVNASGEVVSSATTGREDLVWDLVGEDIVAVAWSGPEALGQDPAFELGHGGWLELFSDASFDTWVLHVAEIILVGPLRES